MTVAELIAALQTFDPDLAVFVQVGAEARVIFAVDPDEGEDGPIALIELQWRAEK